MMIFTVATGPLPHFQGSAPRLYRCYSGLLQSMGAWSPVCTWELTPLRGQAFIEIKKGKRWTREMAGERPSDWDSDGIDCLTISLSFPTCSVGILSGGVGSRSVAHG